MTNSKLKITVAGAGGFAGGELLRLLLNHPNVANVTPLSRSQAGKSVSSVHKFMLHHKGLSFSGTSVVDAAKDSDLTFLAMPHGESQNYIKDLLEIPSIKLVDVASDFRIQEKDAYTKYYGDHLCHDISSKFVYGLPEAFKGKIEKSSLIANPGCFATAAELLLLPLAKNGLLNEITPVFAVTGSSGSGIKPKRGTHHPYRDNNLYAYKMLEHQHTPEINELLSVTSNSKKKVRLMSHSGPFVRGIHATTYINNPQFSDKDINKIYKDYYLDQPFVLVLDNPPEIREVQSTNYVHVHVKQIGQEVEVALALDNLVKGAAGQAIQNMNLMFGFDEKTGLEYMGVYP